MRSSPVVASTRTSRGRVTNRQNRRPTPAAIRMPVVVAPVRTRKRRDRDARQQPARRGGEQPHRRQGHEPGAGPPRERDQAGRDRHPPPAQPRDEVEHAGDERARAGSPSPPRPATPASPCPTAAARASRRARSSGRCRARRRGSRRSSPPGPAGRRRAPTSGPRGGVVALGGQRERRDAVGEQRALLVGRVGDAVAGELVVGAGDAGRRCRTRSSTACRAAA